MANPTTNFGWVMPTSTDLVTDLPADFNTFGQAVDTSMADLKGGTTGQILAKATNTDMDFTWITNDQGDITAVNTTAPLAGGGTSGALTLSIAAATTSVAGAVQLSDSTATTSSVLAATPTAVKSAYDLANAAIPKSLIDAAGDLIVGTAADTAGRLGIGTAGQVLKVNSGATALEWGTAGGGGKVLQVVSTTLSTLKTIATTTYTDTNLTLNITPTSATSKVLVLVTQGVSHSRTTSESQVGWKLLRGATDLANWAAPRANQTYAGGSSEIQNYAVLSLSYLDSPATTSATTYKTQGQLGSTANAGTSEWNYGLGGTTITLLEIGA
jgi:hypothetical protein